jgi:signal transduction histidine kinase
MSFVTLVRASLPMICHTYLTAFNRWTNPVRGLGLSLVRMIVEFYVGTVRMESGGMGQGTAVHVTWPL